MCVCVCVSTQKRSRDPGKPKLVTPSVVAVRKLDTRTCTVYQRKCPTFEIPRRILAVLVPFAATCFCGRRGVAILHDALIHVCSGRMQRTPVGLEEGVGNTVHGAVTYGRGGSADGLDKGEFKRRGEPLALQAPNTITLWHTD